MQFRISVRWLLLAVVVMLFVFQPMVEAKPKVGKGKGQGKKTIEEAVDSEPIDELGIIRSYLGRGEGGTKKKGKKKKRLPPGLQKKLDRGWDLPPGWQKKLKRGEVIPGDVYAQAEKLPDEILRKLPPQTKGVETVILENKVVKILKKTMEVVDILDL